MVDSLDGVALGHVPSDSCLGSGLIFLEVICPFAQEIATGLLFGSPKASAFFFVVVVTLTMLSYQLNPWFSEFPLLILLKPKP